MLNEVTELWQYIGNPSECNRLIPYFFFYKNRGGIPRALSIIARHYLFDIYEYDKKKTNEDRYAAREKVKHILAAWCGFEFLESPRKRKENSKLEDVEKYTDKKQIKKDNIQNWLPAYLRHHPYKETQTWEEWSEKEIASFIQLRAPKWYVRQSKDIYQLVNHTFSINSINFYTIIADAINMGPLQEKLLICNRDFFRKYDFHSYKKYNYFLYIIAAYMLSLEDTAPADQWITLNNIDLSNWMSYPSLGQGKHLNTFFKWSEDFIEYSNGEYHIDSRFLNNYDFKIVAASKEYTSEADEFIFTGNKEDFITSDKLKNLRKNHLKKFAQ